MPWSRMQTHYLCALLENGIELGAGLRHFPAPFEAGGYDERITGAELPASTAAFEDDAALREHAELGFGVPDAPFSGGARPAAGEELLARIAEVVRDELARIAGDEAVGGGARLLGGT